MNRERSAAPTAWLATVAIQVGCAFPTVAREPADPSGDLVASFLAERSGVVERIEIGKSEEGRPIVVLAAGAKDSPALLIVGALDGRLRASPAIALAALGGLLDDPAQPLARAAVYVVPALDVDGYARALTPGSTPVVAGAPYPSDDDRDGLLDEDGPFDVDGDGVVAWMRVYDPKPPLSRTHIVDPDDPRRSREADRGKGETPAFALIRESRDRDGDGQFGEDGIGAIELDRNFPHQYREHAEGSGPWALAANGSRALVDWMLSRPNIEAVLALSDGDSLFELPDAGKYDATNRAPLGLERGDAPFAEELKKQCESAVGWKKSRKAAIEGAFWSWAYAQYGAMSFALDVSRQPARDAAAIVALEKAKAGESEGEGAGEKSDANAKDEPAAAEGGAKKESGEDRGKDAKKAKDLDAELLDAAASEGWGFVEWREFAHPELGRVEIGGIDDDFRRTIRPEAQPAVGDAVKKIASVFLARLPRLEIDAPTAEALGGGVYRVRATVRNVGGAPSPTAIGEKLRRRGSISLRLEAARDRVPSGRLVQTLRKLDAAGGEATAEWLALGKPGETLRITLRAPQLGVRELEVTLPEGAVR